MCPTRSSAMNVAVRALAGSILAYVAPVLLSACQESAPSLPQLLIVVDTDAPVPAFVDRVRVYVFNLEGALQEAPREFPLLNPEDWPLTFGLRSSGDEPIQARLRIRAFRAGYREINETSNDVTIPPGVAIDRLVL